MVKWHFKYYLFNRGTPVSAGVYITDGCNCRCKMCNLWKNKEINVYPIDYQKKAIDCLAKVGCYYYSISGGEPTLVKDLPERLRYATQRLPYVHLVTNGLLMDQALACELNKTGLQEISISIDGDKELHNEIRGRKDAFDKALKALQILQEYAPNINIVINSLLTKNSLQGLKKLNKIIDFKSKIKQKLLPISYHSLFKNTGSSLNFDAPEASDTEMDDFLDNAIKNQQIINSKVFLQKAKLFFRGKDNLIPEQATCYYPYHAIEFDSHGTAFPCLTGLNGKDGCPAKDDLQKYLRSREYRNTQKKLGSCQKCNKTMPVCYYEPRLNFPITNLIKGSFLK